MKAPTEKLYPWGRGQLMAICAVRYCLGRMTYIVGDCVDWLIANWDKFDHHIQVLIKRDIEDAFTKDDTWRNCPKDSNLGVYEYLENHRPLGMDCDRAEWERARKLWKDGSN